MGVLRSAEDARVGSAGAVPLRIRCEGRGVGALRLSAGGQVSTWFLASASAELLAWATSVWEDVESSDPCPGLEGAAPCPGAEGEAPWPWEESPAPGAEEDPALGSGTVRCAPFPSVYSVPTGSAWSSSIACHTLEARGSAAILRFSSHGGATTGRVTNCMFARSSFDMRLTRSVASAIGSARFDEMLTVAIAACRKETREGRSVT